MALAEHASPHRPFAWPTVATIAERLGITSAKARAWTAKAEAAGVIMKCRRRFAHASLGFDLRPWFVAMGFDDARDVQPPAKARIVLAGDVATALVRLARCTALLQLAAKRATEKRRVAHQSNQRGSALVQPAVSSEPLPGIENKTDKPEAETPAAPFAPAAPLPAPARVSVNPRNSNGHDNGREGTIGELWQMAREAQVLPKRVQEFIESYPDVNPAQIGAVVDYFGRHIKHSNSPTACFLRAVSAGVKSTQLTAGER